ncbi:MAG: carboxylating nicotinate-nucleotide diphosphorylase [Actinomycetota bacterium]|nr:carboxylating nicotinate-nucleotide diphosphorylase [Actinomycetota bacterium]
MSAVRDVVARALAEDLGVFGDLTAGLVPAQATVRATIAARSAGVVAGRLAATEAFSSVDAGITVAWRLGDGDRVGPGTVIATVAGPLASVLSAERTVLNLLGHLSGIATLTRRYADGAGPHTRVRDTRKTTPGLRALEKAAVRAGGGVNHRASLSEGILVKDNHLAGLTITEAVTRSKQRWPGQACEVECDTLEQVVTAVDAGADMVLVDNMTPDEVGEAVHVVDGRVPVEVSGGVTLDTIGTYAAAGADLVAVGALTHSAPVLDIGLDLKDAPCSSPST